MGLSLERFDGIGAYRQTENDAEIDPSGALDGTKFVGGSGLGKAVASSQDTSLCVANRALEYALGHPAKDDDAVMSLEQQFAASGYSIRALFLKVASAPATYRQKSAPLDGASTPRLAASALISRTDQGDPPWPMTFPVVPH